MDLLVHRKAIFILVFLLGLIGEAATIDFSFVDHISIAPISVPILPAGSSGIGMARIGFKNGSSGDSYTSIKYIDIEVTGGLSVSRITDVHVWFENEIDEGIYDNGSGDNDQEVDVGIVWAGNTATIELDPATVRFRWQGGTKYLFVAFDFSSSAETNTDVGCEITRVVYGADGVGTGFQVTATPSPPGYGLHGTTQPVDSYAIYVPPTGLATGVAPATANQGESNVKIMRLDLSLNDSSATAYLGGVRVRRVQGADNYVDTNGVLLYEDDGDDVFEPGADDGTPKATATLGNPVAGYAALTLSPSIAVPAAGKSFFIAVNVDSTNAVVGQDLGLDIQNPQADITFVDEIEDDNSLIPSEYAYVTYSVSGLYEYEQKGYITTTSTTPTADHTFTITPGPNPADPEIYARDPSANSFNIDPGTEIEVVFSEVMDINSFVLYPNPSPTFTVKRLSDGADVTGTISFRSYNAVAVFTPNSPLEWKTTYVVTVKSGLVGGVLDSGGQTLAADAVWSFTTKPEYPEVSAPTVIKNRIGTGANSEAVILIPTPPKGASEKMSVQAFTTTGRLVKTFCRNVPYSSIVNGRFLWDGTNDRGEELGPGMYFVQVRSESYKRVLKVMIVR